MIEAANTATLTVATWTPGDGVTRYRFFHRGEDSDYFRGHPIYTALGRADALTFCAGYRKGHERGLEDATETTDMPKPCSRCGDNVTSSRGILWYTNDFYGGRLYDHPVAV